MTKPFLTLAVSLFTSLHAEQTIHHSTNTLGLELFQQLRQDGKNLCLSPYSIQSALSMTLNGAAGDTHKEMLTALHFETLTNEAINQQFKTYQSDLKERLSKDLPDYVEGDKTSFVVANRLFGQSGYTYEKAFLNACKNGFNAPFEALDFNNASEQSRQHINQWVKQATKERINNILPVGSITKDTNMVLTNCIHFKAGWQEKFSKYATKQRPFTKNDGTVKQVDTMFEKAKFNYYKGKNHQTISIPYGHFNNFQFLAILPNKGTSLSQLIEKTSPKELLNPQPMPRTNIKLYLPKFKIEGDTLSLTPALKKIGMNKAFTSQADFSKITSQTPLRISNIFHKTFIQLDEEGTEAAAATAIIKESKSALMKPPTFITLDFNRPFFFAIQDTQTGTCFFMGEVQDPAK